MGTVGFEGNGRNHTMTDSKYITLHKTHILLLVQQTLCLTVKPLWGKELYNWTFRVDKTPSSPKQGNYA